MSRWKKSDTEIACGSMSALSLEAREDELTRLLLEHMDCSHALDQKSGADEELCAHRERLESAIAMQLLSQDDVTPSAPSASGLGAGLLDAPRLAAMAATLTTPTLLEGWGVVPYAAGSSGATVPERGSAPSPGSVTVQEVLRTKHQSPAPLSAEALRVIAKQTPLRQ